MAEAEASGEATGDAEGDAADSVGSVVSGGAKQEYRREHDRQDVEEAAGDAGVAQAEVDGQRAHGQADGEQPQRDVVQGAPSSLAYRLAPRLRDAADTVQS